MPMKVQGVLSILLLVAGALPASDVKKRNGLTEETTAEAPRVMWRDPVDVSSRNLLYGIGGIQHAPPETAYTFVKEQIGGSNPKFVVKDSSGAEWKVKLGPEARPEVVASRFVWAAGYTTDEDYFVSRLRITNMPRLRRGDHLVERNKTRESLVEHARLEREIPGESKVGNWKWKSEGFHGTREWNGLRVLMALINNWDLKDVNNSVYQYADGQPARQVYVVSDLGVSFGTAEANWPVARSRGNVGAYERSKFIRKVTPEYVDFQTPGLPGLIYFFNFPELFIRLGHRHLGRNVPLADVRWMAGLLGRLTPVQIRDAFRAADYSDREVERFATVVEKRIAALREL
jgi:hypothetical protein